MPFAEPVAPTGARSRYLGKSAPLHAGFSNSTLSLSTIVGLASFRCACHTGP